MKVVTSNSNVINQILSYVAGRVTDAAKKAVPNILNRTRILVQDAIEKSPEYKSLQGGMLQGSLGVPNPGDALSNITQEFLNQIHCIVNPFYVSGKRIKGSLRLEIIEHDKSAVKLLSTSSYITDKGETIPWLQWLLEAGQKTIVRDYIAITGNLSHIPQSRTGLGIMKYVPNRVYKVPLEFSGELSNNFVTRSLDEIVVHIGNTIVDEVQWQITR